MWRKKGVGRKAAVRSRTGGGRKVERLWKLRG